MTLQERYDKGLLMIRDKIEYVLKRAIYILGVSKTENCRQQVRVTENLTWRFYGINSKGIALIAIM